MFTVRQHADTNRFFIIEVNADGYGHHEMPNWITQAWANRFAGQTARVIAEQVSKEDAVKAMLAEEVRAWQIEKGRGEYTVVVFYLDGSKKELTLTAAGKLTCRQ